MGIEFVDYFGTVVVRAGILFLFFFYMSQINLEIFFIVNR
jgi:hypothetical protein